jgi:hypothetical protein
LNLSRIISLSKNDIIALKPDLILLMNINNNLKSPGFWFMEIRDSEKKKQRPDGKSPLSKINELVRLRRFIVRYSALALLINELIPSLFEKSLVNFEWEAFSTALMAPDNIWQVEFRDNLNRLINLFFGSNPEIKIILLAEAVNTMKFPAMEAPFNKANQIMEEISKSYNNVDCVDIHSAVINGVKRGKNVWQSPSVDPLHLIREGNEIVADVLAAYLPSHLHDGN